MRQAREDLDQLREIEGPRRRERGDADYKRFDHGTPVIISLPGGGVVHSKVVHEGGELGGHVGRQDRHRPPVQGFERRAKEQLASKASGEKPAGAFLGLER